MYSFSYHLTLLHTLILFLYTDTPTTQTHTLSLHDALPISHPGVEVVGARTRVCASHVHGRARPMCERARRRKAEFRKTARTRAKQFCRRAREPSPHRPTRSVPSRVDTAVRSPAWAAPFDGCPRPRHRGRGRGSLAREPLRRTALPRR